MSYLHKKIYSLLVLAVLMMTAVTGAMAQSNYGAVRGIVTDVQGASLANAKVTLTSLGTKIARTTTTNGAGEYSFSAVDPGAYSVLISLEGFKQSENKSVTVDSGNTIPLDMRLEIGSTTQSIEVTAAEPIVNNGTSYGGQLIDS